MTDTSCAPILRGVSAALGPSLLSRTLSSRVLLVGSGGIGCELLKNLALSGFRDVEVIDLDTIDVSNLNRQFLFRSQHVGMAKCQVASEAALAMVPPLPGTEGTEAAYLPHHGNVCDNSKFNVPYVQKFDLVLNALDNVAARRRVNRLCLAAAVPLVEAGTAGYLGQVTVIDRPSGTECYECQSKPTQKVYPICTIRSTPSQPVHCIVWAKELYKLCFGPKVEDSMLFEDEESLRADRDAAAKEKEEANEGGEEGKTDNEMATDVSSAPNGEGGEGSTYMDAVGELRSLLGIGSTGSEDEAALRSKAQEALTALFATEIDKQIGMDRYKTAEKVPVPISSEDLVRCIDIDAIPPTAREGYNPTDVWSPGECAAEMAACFLEVAAHTIGPDPSQPLPEFDKDDDVAMRFVAAASNLRQCVFGIEPLQSLYDAKGIAGNIIPAIATTNAIVAGLQVLQAFHILKSKLGLEEAGKDANSEEGGLKLKDSCRYTYCLRDKTRKGYLLQPTQLPEPNPNCFVCRNATVSLSLNTQAWTLDMLLARVLKKELGFAEPTIMIGEDIVYEEGDDIDPGEYAANKSKTLAGLPAGGVGHGAVIKVEDFTQDLEVEVAVSHQDTWTIVEEEGGKKTEKEDDREEVEKFVIGGKKPVAAAASDVPQDTGEVAGAGAAGDAQPEEEDSDSDIEVVEEADATKNGGEDAKPPAQPANGGSNGSKLPPTKKRSLGDESGENAAKKAKTNGSDEVEVIELD
ncbi:hypothetical protein ACHAXT_011180 [Thalassiosira profunda]